MVRTLSPLLTLLLASPQAAAGDAPFPGPLAPLVGYCWTAGFPDGKLINTHCFRTINNGHAIEDRHVVSGGDGAYGGIATYHYDRETKRIAYTYLATDGGVSRGELEPTGDGFAVLNDHYVGADGTRLAIRGDYRFTGPASYQMRSSATGNGGERPLFDLQFIRSRPAPPLPAVVAGDLVVSRAIIRAAEAVGVEVAAYLAIDNMGPADRLLAAECKCAEAVELHTMVGEGAERRMEKSWPLDLPAQTRTEVKPGTPRHMMLIRSLRSVRLGEPVIMTLRFERAGTVQVEFQPVSDSSAGW